MEKSEFDKWAKSYDESILPSINTFPFAGYYDVLSAMLSLIEPREEMMVLDVGIGTGLLALELRQKGCLIHGIGFSEKMLDKAILRIPDGQFEIVDVVEEYLGRFSMFALIGLSRRISSIILGRKSNCR